MKIKKIQFYVIVIMFLFTPVLLYSETEKKQATEQGEKKLPLVEKKNSSTTKKNKLNRPAEFIPSEKIKADSSVSFPVDI